MAINLTADIGAALDAVRTEVRGIGNLILERRDKTSATGYAPLLPTVALPTALKWWNAKNLTGTMEERESQLIMLTIMEQPNLTPNLLNQVRAVQIDGQRYYVKSRTPPLGVTRKWQLVLAPNVNEPT